MFFFLSHYPYVPVPPPPSKRAVGDGASRACNSRTVIPDASSDVHVKKSDVHLKKKCLLTEFGRAEWLDIWLSIVMYGPHCVWFVPHGLGLKTFSLLALLLSQ